MSSKGNGTEEKTGFSEFSEIDPKARVIELRSAIQRANFAYYMMDSPELTDADFDAAMAELKAIEASFPGLDDPESPTHKVGGGISPLFSSVTHLSPMMSLDNVFDQSELLRWIGRLDRSLEVAGSSGSAELFFELKIDGLAVSLLYRNGILERAATRGDGLVGEDVTMNVMTIKVIPKVLKGRGDGKTVPEILEVRGELYMPISAFDALNKDRQEKGQGRFANPRNAAAGSLRQKDPKVTATRGLSFWCYQLGECIGGPNFETHHQTLEYLKEMGFPVNEVAQRVKSQGEIEALVAHYEEHRHDLDYDIDGAVIKLDDLSLREKIGSTARAPRWAIAYKFPPQERTTKLVDILVSIGKSGKATPYAVLEPVFVGGSTVQMATLHNQDQVAIKDVRPGDVVVVRKAGDVIPEVIGAVSIERGPDSLPWDFPKLCPECGTPFVRPEGESDTYCPNFDCPAQVLQRIVHFAARGCMRIEGLGEKRVAQLIKADLVSTPADLYSLDREELLKLPNTKEKMADSLIAQITASKERPISKVILGLSIKHVGESAASLIADRYGTLSAALDANVAELSQIDGVGEAIAGSFVQYVQSNWGRTQIERLIAAGVGRSVSAVVGTTALAGRSYVVTGTISDMTREEVESRLKEHGAKVTSSVSSATTALIAGLAPGASKVTKAQKLGVVILTEEDLRALLAK